MPTLHCVTMGALLTCLSYGPFRSRYSSCTKLPSSSVTEIYLCTDKGQADQKQVICNLKMMGVI